jgi:hypothetical protein
VEPQCDSSCVTEATLLGVSFDSDQGVVMVAHTIRIDSFKESNLTIAKKVDRLLVVRPKPAYVG